MLVPFLIEEIAKYIGLLYKPGTSELGDAISSGILGCKGALLQNHGLIAIGPDLEQAFIVAEAVERAAQLTFDLTIFSRR